MLWELPETDERDLQHSLQYLLPHFLLTQIYAQCSAKKALRYRYCVAYCTKLSLPAW